MSGPKRRGGGRRRRPASAPGIRYLRPRLPDGSLGKVVPLVLYPRYSTVVGGDGFAQPLFDVSAFRRYSVPPGGSVTFRITESDDSARGWGGRPNRSRRRAAARSAPGRPTGTKGTGWREPLARRRKARGRSKRAGGA